MRHQSYRGARCITLRESRDQLDVHCGGTVRPSWENPGTINDLFRGGATCAAACLAPAAEGRATHLGGGRRGRHRPDLRSTGPRRGIGHRLPDHVGHAGCPIRPGQRTVDRAGGSEFQRWILHNLLLSERDRGRPDGGDEFRRGAARQSGGGAEVPAGGARGRRRGLSSGQRDRHLAARHARRSGGTAGPSLAGTLYNAELLGNEPGGWPR